jgi:hypothetical protein
LITSLFDLTLTSIVIPKKDVAFARETPGDRHRLTDISRHRDRDKIDTADAPVRGIEGDPTGLRT